MNFELGKSYIVNVTEKGIIPSMEFDRSQWFHKDYDDLEVLTAKEKEITIDEVLNQIRADIQSLRNCSCSCSDGIIDDVENILDKCKEEIKTAKADLKRIEHDTSGQNKPYNSHKYDKYGLNFGLATKQFKEKTEDDWLYETGGEESEILGSGSTCYNVVRTKDENEAMKLSKEAARTYLRRTQTKNGVTITQEYSYREGWIDI